MIDANEKKWVDEAEKEFIDFYGASPKSETFKQYFIQGAVLTRKKAHSGNVDAFKAFTLDLAGRYEKEIQKLKEEIDFKNSQLKTREAILRQEIENLKAELKAERLITDSVVVFADNYCWECDEECVQLKYEGDTCRHEDFFIRARSTVKNRRIVL